MYVTVRENEHAVVGMDADMAQTFKTITKDGNSAYVLGSDRFDHDNGCIQSEGDFNDVVLRLID